MNKLKYSSSPYLHQHADNPVHWQEWGPEALQMAKELNKPLIISIGYAACHWCHVMEHESFSDKEVAEFMNENFVCIKVDREERPDIDQIYMDAVHLIKGQGGWPLNAFALPDGKPFYAGTYFPKQKWMEIMLQISDLYKNEYNKVKQYADELTEGLNNSIVSEFDTTSEFDKEQYLELKTQWLNNTDFNYGGFNRAPKFPLPNAWEFLLEYHYITNNPESLNAVEITLDKMACGGIYDHIGGGLARYSVDGYWKVPHFEKMLYDNAQLVSLYSHAYQITKKDRYKEVVEQTLRFIENELTDIKGGYYSSLNADSESEEGKFYVWNYNEFISAIDDSDKELITKYYQIVPEGNWENGKNIIYTNSSLEQFCKDHNLDKEAFTEKLKKANTSLINLRSKRERPTTDDKILTSWNALMITGYIDAFLAINNDDYLNSAIKASEFIKDNMITENGGLYRSHMNGKSGIDAFLDDYALLADAYLKLYSVTFNKSWLDLSQKLVDYCIEHFYDEKSGLFFYTSDLGEELVAKKIEISDNVIPSSNSAMAKVLLKAGHILSDEKYVDIAIKMVKINIDNVSKSGIWHANWASLLGMLTYGLTEVAITGQDYYNNSLSIQVNYVPLSVFVGGNDENLPLLENRVQVDKDMIYVCRNKACDLPVDNVEEALRLITGNHIYDKNDSKNVSSN
jgi:uncharacterized protein YyaL (SSP411 family)